MPDFLQFPHALSAGGPIVTLLFLMSVTGVAIVLLKMWQFRHLIGGRTAVEHALRAWESGEQQRCRDWLTERQDAVSVTLASGMEALSTQLPESMVREEIERVAARQIEALRRLLPALELIAQLSPLLGLLGTVVGMIEAFRALEMAGNQVNPALLSGGIWQALLTTAAGLVVAVPATVAVVACERTVARTQAAIEDAVTRLFTYPLWHRGEPSNRIETAGMSPQSTNNRTAAAKAG